MTDTDYNILQHYYKTHRNSGPLKILDPAGGMLASLICLKKFMQYRKCSWSSTIGSPIWAPEGDKILGNCSKVQKYLNESAPKILERSVH